MPAERGSTSPPSSDVLVLAHYQWVSPRVMNQVAALTGAGYRVIVARWNRTPDEPSPVQEIDCPVIDVPAPATRGVLSLATAWPRFVAWLSRWARRRRFAIVHCTHPVVLPLALLWRWTRGVEVVYDASELHGIERREGLVPGFDAFGWMLDRIELAFARRCACVLTIDSSDARMARRYRAVNDSVVVLYNVTARDPARAPGTRDPYDGRPAVTYVGGISQDKGAMVALEAMHGVVDHLPDALLVLIGRFHGTTPARYAREIAARGLENAVRIVPWVPRDELAAWLPHARVGLSLHQPVPRFLLLGKGNGRKLFTYMQYGLPVVAPAFGHVGDLVRETGCGRLVDTSDADAVSRAVVELLLDPTAAREMGAHGRRAVQNRYNWEQEQDEFLRHYPSAGEARDRGGPPV